MQTPALAHHPTVTLYQWFASKPRSQPIKDATPPTSGHTGRLPENPFIDAIKQVLRSRQDYITWQGEWETLFQHPFGSFLSTFASDQRYEWHFSFKQLCPAMKLKRASDYVVFTGFNDNSYACKHTHTHEHTHTPARSHETTSA